MVKILSKSGDSLADVYDVQGSIAGIDDLLSKDVNLVHEMGATIFSERLSARVVNLTTGAIAQSTDIETSFVFAETTRLLGIQIASEDASRLAVIQASITSPENVTNNDIPIFVWDATDGTRTIDILIGGVTESLDLLLPANVVPVPNLMVGAGSLLPSNIISLRGTTTAFGAGTVITRMILYVAFARSAGLSSRGLPIPAW